MSNGTVFASKLFSKLDPTEAKDLLNTELAKGIINNIATSCDPKLDDYDYDKFYKEYMAAQPSDQSGVSATEDINDVIMGSTNSEVLKGYGGDDVLISAGGG